MALIACKDCKKEFSTDAKQCPHCGARNPWKAGWLSLIIVIVALIVMARMLRSHTGDDNTAVNVEPAQPSVAATPSPLLADTPAWKKPLPGTKAFLQADPGNIVCGSPELWYKSYVSSGQKMQGCKTFSSGLPVVIEDTRMIEGSFLVAKIHIPSNHFTGYIWASWLYPDIPEGTLVHYTIAPAGNSVHLASDPANPRPFAGTEIGNATAKVMKLDPANGSLYVTILDGHYSGMSGWTSLTLGKLILGDDGKPIDEFSDTK